MITDLIDHARGLGLGPGEVLEAHLSPGETVAHPVCIDPLDTIVRRWHYLPGIDEIEHDLQFGFSDDAYLAIVHDDGIYFVAFTASGVAQ